jgi:hypothetical protein
MIKLTFFKGALILAFLLAITATTSFFTIISESNRISAIILSHADTAHDLAGGKELISLLPRVFWNGLPPQSQKKKYDAVRERVFLSFALIKSLEGEEHFTSGKFVNSYEAFNDAANSVFGAVDPDSGDWKKNKPLWEKYVQLSDRASVMIQIAYVRDLLQQDKAEEAMQEFLEVQKLAASIGFKIPKHGELYRDIFSKLEKELPKKE